MARTDKVVLWAGGYVDAVESKGSSEWSTMGGQRYYPARVEIESKVGGHVCTVHRGKTRLSKRIRAHAVETAKKIDARWPDAAWAERRAEQISTDVHRRLAGSSSLMRSAEGELRRAALAYGTDRDGQTDLCRAALAYRGDAERREEIEGEAERLRLWGEVGASIRKTVAAGGDLSEEQEAWLKKERGES